MEIFSVLLFSSIRTKKMVKMIFCGLFIIPLFLCGCWPGADLIGEYEKDISHKKELWGGYARGQRYILLHDIFLQKEELGFKYRIYAGVPPRELVGNNCPLDYSAPNMIEVYLHSPEQWPLMIGIIKAGTEIECTKILGWGTLMWPMSHTVYATVKDGTYTGKLIDICDLSFTSWVKRGFGEDYVFYPNPSLLKRVGIDEGND